MSTGERQPPVKATNQGQHPVPPAGEEFHLPGGSLLPIITAAAITLAVIGLTIWLVWTAVGCVITGVCIILWARAAREDIAHLPDEHEH